MIVNGTPDEWIGRANLGDVARALQGLDSGTHDRTLVYDRYVALVLADNRTPSSAQAFGQALGELGCDRQTVWVIDREYLHRKWPHLPWTEPDTEVSTDVTAEMSHRPVG